MASDLDLTTIFFERSLVVDGEQFDKVGRHGNLEMCKGIKHGNSAEA